MGQAGPDRAAGPRDDILQERGMLARLLVDQVVAVDEEPPFPVGRDVHSRPFADFSDPYAVDQGARLEGIDRAIDAIEHGAGVLLHLGVGAVERLGQTVE